MTEIKKISYIPYIGTPLKNGVFTDIYKNSWEGILKDKCDLAGIDIQTHDMLPLAEADRIIFFDNFFYRNLRYMWELYEKRLLHKTVYIDYEPPSGHCKNHSVEGLRLLGNIFGKVITYNDYLIDGKKFIKGCIGGCYNKEQKYLNDFNKRKFICMVTNNTSLEQIIGFSNYYNSSMYFDEKNTFDHPDAIYSQRLKAATFFAQKCPDEFNLYGNHWPENLKIVYKGNLDKSKKIKTISKYKFIISYDSIINQKGYISEKIFDCFKAKVVPIYYGADNVTDYIPKECFIDKRNFEDYEALYDYLINMTEKEYNKIIKAIEKYLKSKQYLKLFSCEASADILFNALQEEAEDFSYEKALNSLNKLQEKKNLIDEKQAITTRCISDPNELETTSNITLYFEYHDFTKEDITFKIVANDKELELFDPYTTYLQEIDANFYNFSVRLMGNERQTLMNVYIENNKTKDRIKLAIKWYYLYDFNIIKYKNIKVDGKDLIYDCAYGGKKSHKLLWIFKHDLRVIDRIMLEKRRWIRVTYKIFRLPFLYIKDVIDVFRK